MSCSADAPSRRGLFLSCPDDLRTALKRKRPRRYAQEKRYKTPLIWKTPQPTPETKNSALTQTILALQNADVLGAAPDDPGTTLKRKRPRRRRQRRRYKTPLLFYNAPTNAI